MCVDLREPNKAIIVDAYPLPHMEETLAALSGATVFSTIDLENAYHQVPLHPDSRDLTAFITHNGLFRFCRVPYGLASAPAAFQKMMSTILKDIPNVQNYLDDIICFGRTQQDHDVALDAVLKRLSEAGLRMNEKKCNFHQSCLRFLGHMVNGNGIQPDEDHLQAIMQAPAPTDVTSLRSFLGMLSWYNKFIPNYATLVEPLRACLRQDSEVEWTDDAQQSFMDVKKCLVDSSALALFNLEMPIIVSTDASDYGLGAILSQVYPDHSEHTVAFASRTLTSAERRYSTVEKEAFACVWAVEKCRTYLWGRRFTLRTDHQALTTLLSTRGAGRAGMRIARWSARLLCFTYDVVYRAGSSNHVADCLSRLPLPLASASTYDDEPELVALLSTALTAISPSEFETAAASCPELTALCTQIEKGWPVSVKAVHTDLQPYCNVRNELSVKDNVVFRDTRLVVPVTLRHTLITLTHESHQGIVRTKQRLRELYRFPGMDQMIQTQVSSCELCQRLDKSARMVTAPLQPVPFPDAPWSKLGMDIVGPFDTAGWDCKYAITLTDYYSKWPEVAFTSSVTTGVVIDFLNGIFSRHGYPVELVTDNGPQFTSDAFTTFLRERGIAAVRTAVYNPAANGAIERFNRVLKDCVQSAIVQSKPWKRTVTDFLQVYRSTPHATTGVSPFELLHGRKMRTKLNVALHSPASTLQTTDVRKRVVLKQSQMKRYTDAKRGARRLILKEGDRVRVRKPFHVPKGHCKFSDPVEIEKQVGPNTYLLEDGRKWHSSRLARAVQMPDPAAELAEQSSFCNEADNFPRVEERPSRMRKPPSWLKDFET
ncbi:hypothetical protein PO909_001044 [Leuciscus waleckii]